jgi:hypothetical protein
MIIVLFVEFASCMTVVSWVFMQRRGVIVSIKLIAVDSWLNHNVSWSGIQLIISLNIRANDVMVINVNVSLWTTMIVIMMLAMTHSMAAKIVLVT